MRLLSTAFSIVSLCAAALAQNTWYVDAGAIPPGDGTQAHPYVSIVAALASPSTHSGDTILVAPGSYPGDFQVSTPLHLRSTQGPALTEIPAFVEIVGGGSIDGFTLSHVFGMSLGQASMRHCVVRNPGPMQPSSRGIFYDDFSNVENCVVTGFDSAFEMFFFASFSAQIRNTIAFGNGSLHASPILADFVNCCLPVVPSGPGVTAVGTVLGNPGCWDALHADYHLAPGSPCIDTGAGTDPDGSPADIGALVYDPGYATGPSVYCSAGPTSDGCVASISASGLCSMTSSAPFHITATQVSPHKLGRLIYSFGEAHLPFQGGLLCLAPPLYRTPPSNSGSSGQPPCSGMLDCDFNLRVQSGVDPALSPGRVVYAQYRFRDPFSPGGFGVAFSDAVRFGIAP